MIHYPNTRKYKMRERHKNLLLSVPQTQFIIMFIPQTQNIASKAGTWSQRIF